MTILWRIYEGDPKRVEPKELMQHRNEQYSNFDNYTHMEKLRSALVQEQHGLCCYCMSRIAADRGKMKVEHWHSRSRCPDQELDYSNLLGVCMGGEAKRGEKRPVSLQHCDTRKGNEDLKWNPANPQHAIETRLRYTRDGSIRSHDVTFGNQLHDVLNLNLPLLKANRRSVYDEFNRWLKREHRKSRGPIPRDRLRRKHDQMTKRTTLLTPYCQIGIWLLEQHLSR